MSAIISLKQRNTTPRRISWISPADVWNAIQPEKEIEVLENQPATPFIVDLRENQ